VPRLLGDALADRAGVRGHGDSLEGLDDDVAAEGAPADLRGCNRRSSTSRLATRPGGEVADELYARQGFQEVARPFQEVVGLEGKGRRPTAGVPWFRGRPASQARRARVGSTRVTKEERWRLRSFRSTRSMLAATAAP
jgi:hypothetical protein